MTTARDKLTENTRWKIVREYDQAMHDGDEERAERIMKRLPIPPVVANVIKECFGAQSLLDEGFDLSEAVERYGEAWLHEKGKFEHHRRPVHNDVRIDASAGSKKWTNNISARCTGGGGLVEEPRGSGRI